MEVMGGNVVESKCADCVHANGYWDNDGIGLYEYGSIRGIDKGTTYYVLEDCEHSIVEELRKRKLLSRIPGEIGEDWCPDDYECVEELIEELVIQ